MATPAQLERAELALGGVRFAADHRAWLAEVDGREGWFGEVFVRLFGVDEILDVTEAYGRAQELPGLVLIGTDGSREYFAVDLRRAGSPVLMLDVVASVWADATVQAESFTEFLAQRERGEELNFEGSYAG